MAKATSRADLRSKDAYLLGAPKSNSPSLKRRTVLFWNEVCLTASEVCFTHEAAAL